MDDVCAINDTYSHCQDSNPAAQDGDDARANKEAQSQSIASSFDHPASTQAHMPPFHENNNQRKHDNGGIHHHLQQRSQEHGVLSRGDPLDMSQSSSLAVSGYEGGDGAAPSTLRTPPEYGHGHGYEHAHELSSGSSMHMNDIGPSDHQSIARANSGHVHPTNTTEANNQHHHHLSNSMSDHAVSHPHAVALPAMQPLGAQSGPFSNQLPSHDTALDPRSNYQEHSPQTQHPHSQSPQHPPPLPHPYNQPHHQQQEHFYNPYSDGNDHVTASSEGYYDMSSGENEIDLPHLIVPLESSMLPTYNYSPGPGYHQQQHHHHQTGFPVHSHSFEQTTTSNDYDDDFHQNHPHYNQQQQQQQQQQYYHQHPPSTGHGESDSYYFPHDLIPQPGQYYSNPDILLVHNRREGDGSHNRQKTDDKDEDENGHVLTYTLGKGYEQTQNLSNGAVTTPACRGQPNMTTEIVTEADTKRYPYGSRTIEDARGQPRRYAVRLPHRLPMGVTEHNIQMPALFTMTDFGFTQLLEPHKMVMPNDGEDMFSDHYRSVLLHTTDADVATKIFRYQPNTYNYQPSNPYTPAFQVQEIYEYLFQGESDGSVAPTYFDDVQTHLPGHIRTKICDWLVELAYATSAPDNCVYTSIRTLDRFLSVYDIYTDDRPIELWALICFHLSFKYHSHFPVNLNRLISHVGGRYSRVHVSAGERFILDVVNYRFSIPTCADFLEIMLPFMRLPQTGILLAHFILEVSVQQPFNLYYHESLLAASSLFLARYILCSQFTLKNNYHTYYSVYHSHMGLMDDTSDDVVQFWHPLFKSFLPFAPLATHHVELAMRHAWPEEMVTITGYPLASLGSCVLSMCAALVNVMGFGACPSAAYYNRGIDRSDPGSPLTNIYCLSDDTLQAASHPQDIYTLLYRMNTLSGFGCDCISLGKFIIPVGPLCPQGNATTAVYVKYTKPYYECIALRILPPFDLRPEHFFKTVEEQQCIVEYAPPMGLSYQAKQRALLPLVDDIDVVLLSSQLEVELRKLDGKPFTRHPLKEQEYHSAMQGVGSAAHKEYVQDLVDTIEGLPPQVHERYVVPITDPMFLYPNEVVYFRNHYTRQHQVRIKERFFLNRETVLIGDNLLRMAGTAAFASTTSASIIREVNQQRREYKHSRNEAANNPERQEGGHSRRQQSHSRRTGIQRDEEDLSEDGMAQSPSREGAPSQGECPETAQ